MGQLPITEVFESDPTVFRVERMGPAIPISRVSEILGNIASVHATMMAIKHDDNSISISHYVSLTPEQYARLDAARIAGEYN